MFLRYIFDGEYSVQLLESVHKWLAPIIIAVSLLQPRFPFFLFACGTMISRSFAYTQFLDRHLPEAFVIYRLCKVPGFVAMDASKKHNLKDMSQYVFFSFSRIHVGASKIYTNITTGNFVHTIALYSSVSKPDISTTSTCSKSLPNNPSKSLLGLIRSKQDFSEQPLFPAGDKTSMLTT